MLLYWSYCCFALNHGHHQPITGHVSHQDRLISTRRPCNFNNWFHYSDVTMTITASQTICPRLFAQPYVWANIKENIKAHVTGPLWGESTVTGGFPSQRASNTGNFSMEWRRHVSLLQSMFINLLRLFPSIFPQSPKTGFPSRAGSRSVLSTKRLHEVDWSQENLIESWVSTYNSPWMMSSIPVN